jgi:regulator of protease activity HflC (stomatin/prohibitin superfamily)
MIASIVVFAVISLLVVITISKAVKIVPQSQIWVVERLGKFKCELHPGLNLIVPFVDAVRSKYTTQEQIIDLRPQQVITRDNVNITIDGVVYLRVQDARKATYEIVNLSAAVAQLAQATLRAEVGKMDLDGTLSSRDEMNSALELAIGEACAGWGARVTRVEVSDISVPAPVQEAMELQLRAERERRAIETTAAANKNATIAQAEADKTKAELEAEATERTAKALKFHEVQLAEAEKQRQVLIGQGQKEAIELIASALDECPQAGEYLLAKDRIKAWDGIASSNSQNKVVVPYQAAELVGGLAMLSEFVGKKTAGSQQS